MERYSSGTDVGDVKQLLEPDYTVDVTSRYGLVDAFLLGTTYNAPETLYVTGDDATATVTAHHVTYTCKSEDMTERDQQLETLLQEQYPMDHDELLDQLKHRQYQSYW